MLQAKEAELEKAVDAALEAGYRHIDTAHVYENEKAIGNVIRRWLDSGKVKSILNKQRHLLENVNIFFYFLGEELFLVTKVPPSGNYPEGVPKYLRRSLELLQVDYLDLYLIHTPFGFKDVEGDLHPHTPEGDIDMDLTTDHVAIWKVRNIVQCSMCLIFNL